MLSRKSGNIKAAVSEKKTEGSIWSVWCCKLAVLIELTETENQWEWEGQTLWEGGLVETEWEKVLEKGKQVKVNEAEGREEQREEQNEVALHLS